MEYNTTLIICKRSGRGWSIKQQIQSDDLKIGLQLMTNCNTDLDNKIGSLSTWMHQTNKYKEDNKLLTAIYLYQFEAPGSWTQIFWKCPNKKTCDYIKSKLKNGDMHGEYIFDKTLNDLSNDEIKTYYNKYIAA